MQLENKALLLKLEKAELQLQHMNKEKMRSDERDSDEEMESKK